MSIYTFMKVIEQTKSLIARGSIRLTSEFDRLPLAVGEHCWDEHVKKTQVELDPQPHSSLGYGSVGERHRKCSDQLREVSIG
jgi:hypothetical protein